MDGNDGMKVAALQHLHHSFFRNSHAAARIGLCADTVEEYEGAHSAFALFIVRCNYGIVICRCDVSEMLTLALMACF